MKHHTTGGHPENLFDAMGAICEENLRLRKALEEIVLACERDWKKADGRWDCETDSAVIVAHELARQALSNEYRDDQK